MSNLTSTQASERKRKRTILLVYDESPIWAQVRKLERDASVSIAALRMEALKEKRKPKQKQPSIPSERSFLLKVSEETIRQWRRGDVATAGPAGRNAIVCLIEGLAAFIKWLDDAHVLARRSEGPEGAHWVHVRQKCLDEAIALKSRLVVFFGHYDSEDQETPVYKSGLALGMSIESVQRAIDTAYYASKPLLIKPYIADEEQGRELLGSLQGLYYAWLRRVSNGTVKWLRCTLHVRYLVKMGEQSIIRAKMNLPNLTQKNNREDSRLDQRERDYHEYDGFVDPKPHRIFWSFEKRSSARQDYIHLITGQIGSWTVPIQGTKDYVFHGCAGQYLTCHQDPLQSIKTGVVLLEIVPEEDRRKAAIARKGQEQHAELFLTYPQIGVMWNKTKVLECPAETVFGEKAEADRRRFELYEALAAALATASDSSL